MNNSPIVYRYELQEVQTLNNEKRLNNSLNHAIKIINNSRSLFVMNPDIDFTRNRKLQFDKVIKNIICMETGAIKDELLKFNNYSIDTPTSSAFVQARSKIKPDTFKTIFDIFNKTSKKLKTYKGYRLSAIDRSELPIDNTFYDTETTVTMHNTNGNPFSAFHLNASFDVLECTYDNLII